MQQPIRVLLVDDYAPIRDYVRSALHRRPEFHVTAEASDGADAVRKAQQHQPGLILLDIGLPNINGIEAARRIREVSPLSRIILLTEMRSWSFAEEALHCGAGGYVVKSDMARELLPAIDAVLKGGKFVSSSLDTRALGDRPGLVRECRHEAGFFTDDHWLLDHAADFVSNTLKDGNSAIVLATEPHRNAILKRLVSSRHDLTNAIEQSRYIEVDADEALVTFMVAGQPDRQRFLNAFNTLLDRAAHASRGSQGRIAIFGECVQLLCARGNFGAALEMEHFGNHLFEHYDLHLLCGYSINCLHNGMGSHMFQEIRDAHTAVHFH